MYWNALMSILYQEEEEEEEEEEEDLFVFNDTIANKQYWYVLL
jgi:hypothetical protein